MAGLRASALTCLVIIACFVSCQSYKGLFVMTAGTKSHINFFGGISKALVNKGHEITFISPYKNNFKNESIREIFLPDNNIEKILGNAFKAGSFSLIRASMEHNPRLCVNALGYHKVVEAMKEKYDYIIMSLFNSECFLEYPYQNKIPFIYASPNVLVYPYTTRVGAPELSSITPHKYLSLAYPMTFLERFLNVFTEISMILITDITSLRTERLCREGNLWTPDSPSVLELQNYASLSIINSVRALEVPAKSTPQSVVYAGGIHIQEPNPLPKDLKDWLDGSGENGFILFSLGTGAKPEDMNKDHLRSILNVFRSLDQRIIWKFKENFIEDLPPNVKVSSWLPQQDILAHPNIRLFITHGGLFSAQEAIYFGVPIVGMPIYGDQMSNVAEFEAQGWGRQLRWENVNEDTFRAVILDALINSSIHNEVKRRSTLMKDWPTNPSTEVAYWVEYVIRHKGAKHFQNPIAHMSWYEVYNTDVWLFLLLTSFSVLVIFYYSVQFFIRLCVKLCLGGKHKID